MVAFYQWTIPDPHQPMCSFTGNKTKWKIWDIEQDKILMFKKH